jgi:hypothetical protein
VFVIYCLLLLLIAPPLWSSRQSSWLQIQKSGFDFWHYQIFWEIMVLEQGPLSLVSTIEELLGRDNSGFSLENREYGRRDQSRWARATLHPQKLALTSPTSGGRSVGVVRSRTQATALFVLLIRSIAENGARNNEHFLCCCLQYRDSYRTGVQLCVG